MNTFFVFICLAVSLTIGSAEPPAEKPRGVYFILPPTFVKQPITSDQVEEIMSRLRKEDGSDSGVYHVYLPDGRLQKVQYTTAPISQEKSSNIVETRPALVTADSQLRLAKVNPDGKLTLLTPEQGKSADYKQPSPPSNYVASIQYTDVPPIPGPIYNYNPQPLTRIVRYAPYFQ